MRKRGAKLEPSDGKIAGLLISILDSESAFWFAADLTFVFQILNFALRATPAERSSVMPWFIGVSFVWLAFKIAHLITSRRRPPGETILFFPLTALEWIDLAGKPNWSVSIDWLTGDHDNMAGATAASSALQHPADDRSSASEESLGKRVRRLRERAGLTQQKLGEAVGMTADGIKRIELGKVKKPHPGNLTGLARALSVTVDELLGRGKT